MYWLIVIVIILFLIWKYSGSNNQPATAQDSILSTPLALHTDEPAASPTGYSPYEVDAFNARPCIGEKICDRKMNPEGLIDPSWRAYFPSGFSGNGLDLYGDSLDEIQPDIKDAGGCRQLQYADWMRYLEFEAEKKIAGCNSPPDIAALLWA